MAGCFHGAGPAVVVAHRRQQLSYGRRGRRGHFRLSARFAVVDLDRPDHPAALAQLCDQVAHQIGRGRLPVGPGNGQRADRARGIAIKGIGQDRHGRAGVIDLQHGNAPGRGGGIARLPLHDGHHGPALGGVGEKSRAVRGRADPRDKHIPRPNRPRIFAHAGDG
jgi:hypothetical protein